MTELLRQVNWHKAALYSSWCSAVILLSPVILAVGVFYLLAEWEDKSRRV